LWCHRQSANQSVVSANQFSNRMSAQPTNTATLNTAHQSDQYPAIAIVSPTLDRPANQDSAGMLHTSQTGAQLMHHYNTLSISEWHNLKHP
jgi:hypothetical protein